MKQKKCLLSFLKGRHNEKPYIKMTETFTIKNIHFWKLMMRENHWQRIFAASFDHFMAAWSRTSESLRAWKNRKVTLSLDYIIQQQQILLKIRNISNYITFPPQAAYKLIEVGRTKDILQVQGLSIDGLNNSEDFTIQ